MQTVVLEKIESIEKEVRTLKKIVMSQTSRERKQALKAIAVYKKESRAGKLKALKDPKELLG